MKIYRIALPLPFDDIPVEEGERKVDYSLQDYHIQELDEKYGLKSNLGSGMFGVAYSTFDNKVVKITTDFQEFELAKSLIGDNWQVHAPFARVYEAYEIEEGLGLYVIVKERLKKLSEEEQNLFMLFTDEFDGTVDKVTEEYADDMAFFEKFEEYYMDVMNYGFADVLNVGNIGWDEYGNIKAFDPRMN
jgi:hypothetical protein